MRCDDRHHLARVVACLADACQRTNARATIHLDCDRYQDAIDDATKALELGSISESLLIRGDAYYSSNRCDEALTDLTLYLSTTEDPFDRTLGLFKCGVSAIGLGRLTDAVDFFNKALEVDPKHIASLDNRGYARYWLGQHELAVTDFTDAIAAEPHWFHQQANRGLALRALGRLDEAKRDFEQSIEGFTQSLASDPTPDGRLLSRARAHRGLGQYEQAIGDLDHVLNARPEYLLSVIERGAVRFESGDVGGSERDFEQAKRMSPYGTREREREKEQALFVCVSRCHG